jgi:hypothetical protein
MMQGFLLRMQGGAIKEKSSRPFFLRVKEVRGNMQGFLLRKKKDLTI